MQETIAILIIAFSFGYAAYKIYRFFNKPVKKGAACGPDECNSCPYEEDKGCDGGINRNRKNSGCR